VLAIVLLVIPAVLAVALLVLASALIPLGLHIYVNNVPIRPFGGSEQRLLRAFAVRSTVRVATQSPHTRRLIAAQAVLALATAVVVYIVAQTIGYVPGFSVLVAGSVLIANSAPLVSMFAEPERGSLRNVLFRSVLVLAFTWAVLLGIPAASQELDARFTPTAIPTDVPPPATVIPPTVTPAVRPTSTPIAQPLFTGDLINDAGNFSWDGSTWIWSPGQLVSVQSGTTRLIAPYRPSVSEYAIESQIEANGFTNLNGNAFGIFASEGRATPDVYYGGVDSAGGSQTRLIAGFGDVHTSVQRAPATITVVSRTPLTDPHLFRLEVRTNKITFSMDGSTGANFNTNTDLRDHVIGVWTDYTQVTVRSFKVLAIQPEPVVAEESSGIN
jgi:hypothetical protein